MKEIKCEMRNCVMNYRGECEHIIPTIIKQLKPSVQDCPFYETPAMNKKLKEMILNKKRRFDDAPVKKKRRKK